ncbi:MAG: hypothetical protein D6803_04520 [Anaerolineae bacterium]|nr:MAG: hypothetical protein D6803_04520 [Anaerolineae bacterium]
MPATVTWHPDYDDVLLMTISGSITMDEAFAVTVEESKLVESAGRKVHTIIDLREVQGVPSGFLQSLPRLTQLPAVVHPNAGKKIVVGARGMAETMLRIFSNVYRRLHMVSTMEEAERILREE